jgi:hypothetical protein
MPEVEETHPVVEIPGGSGDSGLDEGPLVAVHVFDEVEFPAPEPGALLQADCSWIVEPRQAGQPVVLAAYLIRSSLYGVFFFLPHSCVTCYSPPAWRQILACA